MINRHLLLLCAALFCISFLAAGCTSTFIVTKDGRGYNFGSSSEKFRKMMCESGDLQAILKDTSLSQENRDKLLKYNCVAGERSPEKVKEIYISLTVEERRDLRLSFQKHGYDINYLEC